MCGDAVTEWAYAKRYTKRKGMDGPFFYPNGQVLYFDQKEQEYYDPTTDLYVPSYEVERLKQQVFDLIGYSV